MYEKRRVVLKGINKFWPVALMNSEMIALQTVHYDDQNALSFLEDLWIVRDPQESRAFTLEFVSLHLRPGCDPCLVYAPLSMGGAQAWGADRQR